LVSVSGGSSSASFAYDGDGNRVKATIVGDLVAFERSSGYGNYYGRRYVFRDHHHPLTFPIP